MTDVVPAAATTAAATIDPVGLATDTEVRRRRLPAFGLVFGSLWLLVLVFLAVFADYLPFIRLPTTPVPGAGDYAFGPGADFWFGSDRNGRDVFARCIYGARISLIISVASIVIGLVVGTAVGMLAGYRRGWTDRVDLDLRRRPARHPRHRSWPPWSSAGSPRCARARPRCSASASSG